MKCSFCVIGVLASLLLVVPDGAAGKDVLSMTNKEINALSETQVEKLPAVDAFAVSMAEDEKEPPRAREAVVLFLSSSLHALGYIAAPTVLESADWTTAVKTFQRRLGVAATGVLLVGEASKLLEAARLMVPGQVVLPFKSIRAMDGYVFASGTWVFESDTQADPIQTSEIRCYRSDRVCRHVVATVAAGSPSKDTAYLSLFEEEFSITKWTADEIVAESDSPVCVAYTLTIGIRKKEAHLFRRKKKEQGCEAVSSKPQVLSLVDGSGVSQQFYERREEQGRLLASPDFVAAIERVRGWAKKRK